MTRRPHGQNGLTLIELLITVIVVSILAAIAIPIYVSQRDKAKNAVLKTNTRDVLIAVQTHVASGLDKTGAPRTTTHSPQRRPTPRGT